jgi:hypothetical protein
MARKREMPISDLRVTNHGIRVLQVMRDADTHIFYDEETCVLLTEPRNRRISHKTVKSLRTQRLIRPQDKADTAVYILTQRGKHLLATDARTRARKEQQQ